MELSLVGSVVAAADGLDLSNAFGDGMHDLVGGGDLGVGDVFVGELRGVREPLGPGVLYVAPVCAIVLEGTTRGLSAGNQRLSGSRFCYVRDGRFHRFLTSSITSSIFQR